MAIILGVESTAHTFGIGVVKDGKILANVKSTYTTEKGGIIPLDAAKHHEKRKYEIYEEALKEASVKENDIDAIAFSQGPGLAPCLLVGMRFTKEIAEKLKKPVVPVNHCIAHLEIGRITGAKDPVMLYASGANTQIIAYASGKFRIFGETLDVGVGNFIDNFARHAGIGFPGGPKIQEMAEKGKNFVELPYKVKGMDVAFSGILTNLKQKIERLNNRHKSNDNVNSLSKFKGDISIKNSDKHQASESEREYTINDLAYSLQEVVFAMLVETSERALAHTGKKELLLGGGVGCNKRLQEMCEIMCRERGAKFFVPSNNLLTDNGSMIAFLGEIMFKSGISQKPVDIDIKPRQRTDNVEVSWR